jgi:hypothetical protein
MTRLPDRERILNAYAAGFAPGWIAGRFGVSYGLVQSVLQRARAVGDTRAVYSDSRISAGRARMTRSRLYGRNGIDATDPALRPDAFPDLPEINEPILPFGGRVPNMDETA